MREIARAALAPRSAGSDARREDLPEGWLAVHERPAAGESLSATATIRGSTIRATATTVPPYRLVIEDLGPSE